MISTTLISSFAALALGFGGQHVVNAQVTATGTMGTTNPPQATMPTAINQTSYSRLLSVNSIDDFCIFAPPEPGVTIGDSEAYEVAWCTQPRNNARVIPDGVLQAVHFVKTPMYVQVQGWGDFTKLNIQAGDQGGELDPHGATGDGNPVGGNVTSNVTGTDVSYQEWMNYMSYQQFCIRVCTAETSSISAALQCQHTLDEMGCNWVMPGDYTNNSFTSCDADAAIPPGLYPQPDGSTSTFAQRYTQVVSGVPQWTIGNTVTPQTAASTPASSNCQTFSTVSNGIASLAVSGAANSMTMSGSMSMTTDSTGKTATMSASGSGSRGTDSARSSGASSGSQSSGAALSNYKIGTSGMGSSFAVGFSVFAVVAGAGALFL